MTLTKSPAERGCLSFLLCWILPPSLFVDAPTHLTYFIGMVLQDLDVGSGTVGFGPRSRNGTIPGGGS